MTNPRVNPGTDVLTGELYARLHLTDGSAPAGPWMMHGRGMTAPWEQGFVHVDTDDFVPMSAVLRAVKTEE